MLLLQLAMVRAVRTKERCASNYPGNFVVGETYTIKTAGTTDFIAIGSADNKVGTTLTATGTGSGSGTASPGSNKLPKA